MNQVEYIENLCNFIEERKIYENYKSSFYSFNGIFVEFFLTELTPYVDTFKSDSLLQDMRDEFTKQISELTLRVLILDFHNWQKKNEEVAKHERYERYCYDLCSKSFLDKIVNTYPVLIKKLYLLHTQTLKHFFKVFSHIQQDKDILSNEFGFDSEKILHISFSDGDKHNDGQFSVILGDISGRKILYKPHSLINDMFFSEVVNWLNLNLSCALFHPKTVSRKNYGWQEFIYTNYQKCKNLEEFYHRYGELLALSYMLGMSDLHFDNVIMTNNSPIVIDTEVINFNNTFSDRKKFDSQQIAPEILFAEKISETVFQTLLIPNNFANIKMDVNFSPLLGSNQRSKNIKVLKLEHEFSYKIRLVERNFDFTTNFQGEVGSYSNRIIQGFQECYMFFLTNNSDLQKFISELLLSYQLISRQVIRPTYVYTKFIESSNHPVYLKNQKKQDDLFIKFKNSKYFKSNLYRKQVDYEIESLQKGDIPYFYTIGDSTNLECQEGTITDYYIYGINKIIIDRINNLCYDDMISQIRLIELSLSSINKSSGKSQLDKFYKDYFPKDIKIVYAVADYICHEVIWDEDMTSCTLATHFEGSQSLKISNTSPSLYDGGGIAIFLYEIYLKTQDIKYKKIADGLLNSFENSKLLTSDILSAFSGIGSLIYIYYILYKRTGDIEFKKRYNSYIFKIGNISIKQTQSVDFVNGLSGLIVLFSNIYRETQDDYLLLLAEKYISFVKSNLSSIRLTGVAHGYSGLVYAFSEYFSITQDLDLLVYIEDLIKKEDKYYSEEFENWEDLREDKIDSFPTYWCYGAPGILVVRQRIQEITPVSLKLNKFNLQSYLGESSNHSLCHGSFGILSCFLKFDSTINSKIIIDEIRDKLAEEILNSQIRCGLKNVPDMFSFMLGLSGIAYEILREHYLDLPNILFLEV